MTMHLDVLADEPPVDRRQTVRADGRFRKCWLPSSGVILNLGEGGALLETLEPLEPGQRVTLRVDAAGGAVRVSVRVCWSRQVAGVRLGATLVPVFQVGVAISNGSDAVRWRDVVNGACRRAEISSSVDGPGS